MLHHTTRPSLMTSRWDDLDSAVRAVVGERGTGSLTISGDQSSGTIFFEDGHITFALSPDDDITRQVDPRWFEATGAGPVALQTSLAHAVSPAETAARVGETIDSVIQVLRRNDAAVIEFTSALSPVETPVAFDAGEWFDLTSPTAFGVYRLTRIV